MDTKIARNRYIWLWVAPFITIPSLIAIVFILDSLYIPFWNFSYRDKEIIIGILAPLIGALWYLILLIPTKNNKSDFVRWHTKQALAIAGIQTTIPILFIVYYGFDLEAIFFIPVLLVFWFFSTLLGQIEASKGNCTLRKWLEKKTAVPDNINHLNSNKFSHLDPDSLIEIIRISKNNEERKSAFLMLSKINLVETMDGSDLSSYNLNIKNVAVNKISSKQRKTNIWVILSILIIFVVIITSDILTKNNNAERKEADSLAIIQAEQTRITEETQIIATAQAAQSLLNDDYFSKIEEFSTFDGTTDWFTGQFRDYYGEQERSIVEGKYRWNIKSDQDAIFWEVPDHIKSQKDFKLSTEFEKITGANNTSYGLIFRFDRDNFYLFEVSSNSFAVFLRKDLRWESILPWKFHSGILKNGPNKLTVIANGANFSLYINDVFLNEFEDSTLTNGLVGIYASPREDTNATIDIDNFILNVPND